MTVCGCWAGYAAANRVLPGALGMLPLADSLPGWAIPIIIAAVVVAVTVLIYLLSRRKE